MSRIKYLSLLLLLVFSIGSVNAQETASGTVITRERTACFGSCPVYTVSILDKGTVIYEGENFVRISGEQTSEIAPVAAITSIAQLAEIFGYFDWQDRYEERVITDQTTVTTSIRWEDHSKRIVRYNGDPNAPIGVVRIEESIDQLVAHLVSA